MNKTRVTILLPSATDEHATPEVCLNTEFVTLFCAKCGKPFTPTNKRQRFCGGTCRVAAHREPQRAKRRRWTAERFRDKGLEFDGRYVGPIRNMGPLALFEKEKQA